MTVRPWYQETWPWVLIAIPFSAVAFGMVMIYTALQYPDDLVIDNYYKEGKGINRSLDSDRLAEERQIRAVWKSSRGNAFQLTNADDAAVVLNTYHVTDSNQDGQLILYPDDANVYSVDGDEISRLLSSKGVWYLEIKGAEVKWRLRKRVVTPVTELVLE